MRHLKDLIARRAMALLTGVPALLVLLMLLGLLAKSRPILALHSFPSLLFGTVWRPLKGQFGFLPFLAGTLGVTLTAMVIAVPVSLLTAVYLSEYAPRRVKQAVVGRGSATKPQVAAMVMTLLNLRAPIEPEDASDALAIALCHAHTRRIEERLP